MTISTLFFQKADPGDPDIPYSSRDVRQITAAIANEGVIDKVGGDFHVSPRAAGANFTVDVATGRAVVAGDDEADQGSYLIESDAVVNVGPFGAAPGSGGRIDLVVLQVNDPTGILEVTLEKVVAAEPVEKKLEKAIRDGQVRRYHGIDWFADAVAKGVLTADEADQLREVERLVARVIAVDHFDPAELKPNYATLGHNARGPEKLAAE